MLILIGPSNAEGGPTLIVHVRYAPVRLNPVSVSRGLPISAARNQLAFYKTLQRDLLNTTYLIPIQIIVIYFQCVGI